MMTTIGALVVGALVVMIGCKIITGIFKIAFMIGFLGIVFYASTTLGIWDFGEQMNILAPIFEMWT